MNALLNRCLSDALDHPRDEISDTYVIVHDSVGKILDEPVQSVRVVHVLQESQHSMLFRQRSEPYDDSC